jgi:hypothetical protein
MYDTVHMRAPRTQLPHIEPYVGNDKYRFRHPALGRFRLLKQPLCAAVCLAGGVVPWHTFYLAGPLQRREMKNRISVSELSEKLGYPSSETIEGLRLLKAFIRLSPPQRAEIIDMVERLATDPAPVPGGMNGRHDTR